MGQQRRVGKMDKKILAMVDAVIRWRWVVFVGTLALVMLAASGAKNLYFDTNYRVFFSADNPQLMQFEKMQDVYSKNDNILFVIAADDELFQPRVLSAIERLTEESWQIPFSTRVDAITNFQYSHSEDDDLIVEDLIQNAIQASSEELAQARVIALEEPFLFKQLISENGTVTGVNVTLQFPGEHITEVPEAVSHAREIVARLSTDYPELEIHMTGMAMLNNAFSEASMGDMQSLVPLMYLAMILVMAFSLRSVTGTFVTLLVVTFSTLVAMGVAGWFHTGLTPPTASAPTIIMTLAIADSIHILVSMLGEMRRGLSKRDAIRESIRINFQPVFLTSVSTAIGFLIMNFSEVPPFTHLGNITTVGVVGAFLFSVIFLPAAMAILPVKVSQKENVQSNRFVDAIAEFVIRQQKSLLWGGTLVALGLGALLFTNKLDDRFIEYFDQSVAFRVDTDYTLENLTGVYQVEYSLEADGSEGISDPAYLERLEAFANWYREQPGVVHVRTFSDVMKRLNKNMHADDPEWYTLPQDRQMAAQYLLLYEMSLPYGLDLNNQINIDKSATRVIVTLDNLETTRMIELAEQGEQWLRDHAPEAMFSYASGPPIMFSHISKRQLTSMIKGSIVALLLISLMMIFALGSTKIGILSLIPNVMPAAIGFGIWGITSGSVGIGLSIVMGMTLGIVVDDTVHFLSKYLRARREHNLSPEDAVRYAFHTVGRALIVTSAILVVGFVILANSSFAMNSDMGRLTSIVLFTALLADFLFLPPLLLALERISPLKKEVKPEAETKTVQGDSPENLVFGSTRN